MENSVEKRGSSNMMTWLILGGIVAIGGFYIYSQWKTSTTTIPPAKDIPPVIPTVKTPVVLPKSVAPPINPTPKTTPRSIDGIK